MHSFNVCLLHLLIDFVAVLGNVVPEPFSEDKTKLSRSPSFSSWISKVSYLGHVAPMSIPSIL
jgi:hypothetical protein